MKKTTQIQQGDVTLEVTKIPVRAKVRRGLVLAEGEATGHAHRIACPKGINAELLELGGRLFLRILGGDATVIHEEHKPVTLPPGEYEVGRVLEYDYDADESRQVVD